MATIKIGTKFFRKERDNLYSDWPTAFWREMLQNSLDAGAKTIKITIESCLDACLCCVSDDGCGMSREVIEDKFFVLGETTKSEGDGIGGFGRARILTCFAMDRFYIWTGRLEVRGQGAEYEIIERNEPDYRAIKGCDFQVTVGDKDKDTMLAALKDVLSRSQLDCEVLIDGEKYTDWMYRRKLTRELSCGEVFVNKSQSSNNKIIVRVNGLYMFDLYTSARPQVIVEVDPKKSRSILTVSRDSLHYDYQSNLTQFLAEVAIDKKSALQSRKRKTRLVRGLGVLRAYAPGRLKDGGVERGSRRMRAVSETMTVDLPSMAVDVGSGTMGSSSSPASRPVDEVEEEVLEGEAYKTDLPSIYINDETENKKVQKVIANFDPTKWVHAVKKTRGKAQPWRKGATYLKLLLAWKACCEEAIRALMVQRDLSDISWMIGWDFSEDSEACCAAVEGAHALCLNPVDAEGQLRYKISNRDDLMALMALAKHEVAHVVMSCHDEDFSTLHTAIDKSFNPWEALRRIKKAIASAN